MNLGSRCRCTDRADRQAPGRFIGKEVESTPIDCSRMHRMKHVTCLLVVAIAFVSTAYAQRVTRDIPYATAHERQMLDIYAPDGAKNLPVVFWIHGGGWQAGDKAGMKTKPQAFMDKGFVFVSTNYRLLPDVDMGTLIRDVAKSFRWMHDHIAEHGGDPRRVLV